MFNAKAAARPLYRLSRSHDPLKLVEWKYIEAGAMGRWDDPTRTYRVLYTADTEVGAYVEVLADLRPRAEALAILDDIDDDGEYADPGVACVQQLAEDRLRGRYLGALIPVGTNHVLVDPTGPASRSELESLAHTGGMVLRLKIGDLNGSDTGLCRMVSRMIFNAPDSSCLGHIVGVVAPSAEHDGTMCHTYFETGKETNELRGQLVVHTVNQAMESKLLVSAAMTYLVPTLVPSP